jgi:hypothetical protein
MRVRSGASLLASQREARGGLSPGEKASAERDGSTMDYLRFVIVKEVRASGRRATIARMTNLRISE